jgi:hypothetical protein
VKELEKAVVKLYARILGFLSMAKQYLEQGTVSTYMLSTTWVITNSSLERTMKSAFLTGTDLGSSLNEIQTAENNVDRCMALVDRIGSYSLMDTLTALMPFADNIDNYAEVMDLLAHIDKPLRRMDNSLKNIHDNLRGKKTYKLSRQ